MAPRPEDDALTESELAELKRNLLVLSGPSVVKFYRDVHRECSLERKPNPKAMQIPALPWALCAPLTRQPAVTIHAGRRSCHLDLYL